MFNNRNLWQVKPLNSVENFFYNTGPDKGKIYFKKFSSHVILTGYVEFK